MYYRAKELAIRNGQPYHLAAILKRGHRVIRVASNSTKTHPRFKRVYSDGTTSAQMHAEMSVLRFAQPGDELEVMRFRRCDHSYAMAKPCHHCMQFMTDAGISRVRYTNRSGKWEEIFLT